MFVSLFISMHLSTIRLIGIVGRLLAYGPRDQGSNPGQVIPKT